MTNYAQARTNMVDGQIHPNGIIIPKLLNAYETLPRERFVPAALREVAYNDEDLDLGEGRFLLEPISHARMVQALEPKADHVVLDIGGTYGYSAAIFSKLVSAVIAVEDEKSFIESANPLWEELGLYNISAVVHDLVQGAQEHAPYDSIFINGAVAEIPKQLVEQLRPEGMMICVLRAPEDHIGRATLVQNLGNGQFSSYTLFDVACPYVKGFEPRQTFQF